MSKIRNKMILGICIIAIAACVALGGISSYILYNNSYNNMKNTVETAATAYTDAIQNEVALYESKIKAISMNSIITNPDVSEPLRKKQLDEFSYTYGFVSASVADSTGQTYSGINVSDREYYKKAMSGKTNISGLLDSRETDSIVMVTASPVNNSTGFEGIVYAAIGIDKFSEKIAAFDMGEGSFGFILDSQGTVLAHRDVEIVENFTNYITLGETDSSYRKFGEISQEMIAGSAGTGNMNFGGKNYYVSYRPISGSDGWSFGVAVDVNSMMAGVTSMLVFMVIATLVIIGISVLGALWIAGSVTGPIISVSKRMALLSDGDLTSEIPQVRTRDETAILATSLEETVHSLKSYIGEITQILRDVEEGDLRVTPTLDYKGDFAPIKIYLESIIASFNGYLHEIGRASNQVTSRAGQVAGGSQALSQGAAEQASSIEEFSATIYEMSGQMKENAGKSSQASEMTLKAAELVDYGTQQMIAMTEAMEEINKSSDEIKDIIKTIDNIAFQTNILALNAAVEAARAGQAGKGFAVVADEVRNLAVKSAQAAQNTTDLIEKSAQAVDKGSMITEKTAGALTEIVMAVNEINRLIDDINSSTNEQAENAAHLKLGVEQISAVVQTNSATAEESAAASQELESQAQILMALVTSFELRDMGEQAAEQREAATS